MCRLGSLYNLFLPSPVLSLFSLRFLAGRVLQLEMVHVFQCARAKQIVTNKVEVNQHTRCARGRAGSASMLRQPCTQKDAGERIRINWSTRVFTCSGSPAQPAVLVTYCFGSVGCCPRTRDGKRKRQPFSISCCRKCDFVHESPSDCMMAARVVDNVMARWHVCCFRSLTLARRAHAAVSRVDR